MREVKLQIAENVPLRPDVFRLRLAGDCEAVTAPGQFVSLSIPGLFLRARDLTLRNLFAVRDTGHEADDAQNDGYNNC
jgi:NAD(P)H-flavin reductase